MQKNVSIFLLITLITFAFIPLALADNVSNYDGELNTSQEAANESYSPPAKANWVDKLLAAPLQGIIAVLQALGMKDYDELIFNMGSEEYAIPPWVTWEAWHMAEGWFNIFYFASYGLIFLAILFTGFKLSFNAYNPKAREETQKAFMRWLYAFLIMWGAPLFLTVLIDINNAGVDLCLSAGQAIGIFDNEVLQSASDNKLGDAFLGSIQVDHLLSQVIIQLGYMGLLVYFNILYIIRDLILLGLYAFTPILVWLWAINNNEIALKTWFGESTSVIFMQFVHAFGLVFFISIAANLPWWGTLVALATLIPFTKMIRNIFQGFFQYFGVNEEQVAGGVLGTAGSLVMMSKMATKKSLPKSNISSDRATTDGAVTGTNPLAGNPLTGNTLGSGGVSGFSSNPLQTASNLSPKFASVGKAAGTAVGLAMAAPLSTVSPMLGGAMLMGSMSAGEKIGGTLSNTGVIGGSIAKDNINGAIDNYKQGGLGQALNSQNLKSNLKNSIDNAATIRNPIDTKQYPGYTGTPYTEERPESTKQATIGLTRAILSKNPIEGYKKGVQDPTQWK